MKALSLLSWGRLCVFAGMSLFAIPVQAQTNGAPVKPATTIGAEQNPFDFVMGVAENQGRLKRRFKDSQQASPKLAISGRAPALQYRNKFGGTAEQAQALRKTLVEKYGEPKSIRGQSHVWDIKNPNGGGSQADFVTIILKIGETGGYELIMDRDRGENGRATWAAPRIEVMPPKKQQSQARRKQPILQPDND